ncbi:ras association domain-containing protein 1 isoform X1 [Denticeps clupeoides]|uniref:Ras association domain-containing protein 1 n=1 Tax=Denticeps clupeoides TaxID=299321 RepID=A0AAY4A4N9_9TELE|nr:ras association domain-containing protein 1-like isoform X1 [Denticeps clupeoides]XP_028818143.1 ras association domain-containing protein 1-like isoform X1 [Denticeps clupeoides]XP_028818150.1 ras association domain-containing protein 1-like isoform X1 [Denticeps clupeoides]
MAKCELIELKDMTLNDGIELAPLPTPPLLPQSPQTARASGRPDPSRVLWMLGDSVTVEEPAWTPGEGHNFQPCGYTQLTWCDLCGEFIWGLYRQSLRCTNCKYTCHYRCQAFIQLDCSSRSKVLTEQMDISEDIIETDTNVDEQIEWEKQELTINEIQQKVKEYNAQIDNNHYMVFNRDGSYTGFIKVHFKLARPVSLPAPRHSISSHDGSWQEGNGIKTHTSFYLPKDTAKHLHISCHTRACDVIEALLNKFTMVDNPAKFALFERSERKGQVHVRRLADEERPLHLRLCAGPSEKALGLLLRENETGEVNWHAFSLPELRNFLQILQREEDEHVRQIVKRYALARAKMKEALSSTTTPG